MYAYGSHFVCCLITTTIGRTQLPRHVTLIAAAAEWPLAAASTRSALCVIVTIAGRRAADAARQAAGGATTRDKRVHDAVRRGRGGVPLLLPAAARQDRLGDRRRRRARVHAARAAQLALHTQLRALRARLRRRLLPLAQRQVVRSALYVHSTLTPVRPTSSNVTTGTLPINSSRNE